MPPSDPRPPPLRVLILGGTSEATALARALAGRDDVDAMLSLAGRTTAPAAQALPVRIGGFGGVDGLAAYLRTARIDMLVDATHPFAAQMSLHARDAARLAACALIRVSRAPWRPGPGDRWTEVATMAEAAAALGSAPRRVFLTIGRLRLDAFAMTPAHHYLVRTVEALRDEALPNATFIQARGPFDLDAELRLLRDHRIEVLVTKNSGGAATTPKLTAAQALGLPVIMVRRPDDGAWRDVDDALAAILAHATLAHATPAHATPAHATSARRGV